MSYWKTKVMPRIKKYFDKPGKKKGAAETCKSFETTKGTIDKEFEERKEELKPKVIEIYNSSNDDIQAIVKKPTEEGIKKHPQHVQKLLEELAKVGFPGAEKLSEAGNKYGPPALLEPVTFLLQKASLLVVEEEAAPTDEVKEIVPTETPEGDAKSTNGEPVIESKEVKKEPDNNAVSTVAAADERPADEVVVEKVEKVEETTTDDGKTVVTVEVIEAVVVKE
eukprot:Gb_26383 [translate_table: standard]